MEPIIQATEKVSDVIGECLGREHQEVVTGKIFVTGGRGVLGYRVALRLLEAGSPSVRVGFRHPDDDCAQALSKKGAEVVGFDWIDENTFSEALKGVKIVFCEASPNIEKWSTIFPTFLRACEEADVKYFVKVSFYHSRKTGELFHKASLVKLHGKSDSLLAQSSIPYTILSASHFMSNQLVQHHNELVDQDTTKPIVLHGSSDGKNVNFVSPNDIAEVAARILLYSKSHMGKEYTLTGVNMSDDDAAAEIAKHTHRPVFFEDLPITMYEDIEHNAGVASWKVRELVGMEMIKASGLEEDCGFASNDIEKICKRKPESFHHYLESKQYMTPLEAW